MAQVMIPVWKDLEAVIQSAWGELIICSPFYSETGLNHALKNSEEPEVSLNLGEVETSIRFVESHFSDIRTILGGAE